MKSLGFLQFPVLQLVISQVKDADLLCRVLGDVREAPRGQKPRQGPVDYINAAPGCHRRDLIQLGSSVTETLVLRCESKAYIESISVFECHFL